MAKFNGNIYYDEFATDENEMRKAMWYFQECLPKEQFKQLREDYAKSGRVMPYWKFVFDNVEVKYVGKQD